MDNLLFDDLARALATELSRRQVLKALLGGAGAGLLALIGLNSKSPSTANAGPEAQTSNYRLFLPLVVKSCTVASSCGQRLYCSSDKTCICVKSAEGPIRCGKIPSNCNAQLCQTSADCANLGPGYFCDTPNSGCCTNPPAELPRCIAPCISPTCPPERVCGTNCCPEGQVCVGTACCPTAQVCGAKCCPTGQECLNGRCVLTCAGDPVTYDSILAARAALAGGANQVALSPNGCLQYSRTLSGTTVTREEIKIKGGALLLSWNHSATGSTGQQDGDLDGYAERSMVLTRGATTNDDRLVITNKSASAPYYATDRRTLTRTGGILHVFEEQADTSGVLQPVARYDPGPWMYTQHPAASPVHGGASANRPSVVCTAVDCSPSEIERKFRDAVTQGLACLSGHKAYDLETRLIDAIWRYPITFRCTSIPARPEGVVLARTSLPFPFPLDLFPNATIELNQDTFCGLTPDDQLAVLFHESMHLDIDYHDPDREKAPNKSDVDRFYACQQMCFHPHSATTQCTCATCLGTTKCDGRCDTALGFQTCSDDFGAWCPCPTRLKWYPSCSECLVGCPSGLGCSFVHICLPVNARRCTPTTCP